MISGDSLQALYRRPPGTAAAAGAGASDQPWIPTIAIISCMDWRLNPERSLGLGPGDAFVLRNAGGRVSGDALRSLIVAWSQLGVQEVVVIQHTGCGLLGRTNEELRRAVGDGLAIDPPPIDFLPIASLEDSVASDVDGIRSSPWIPDDTVVTGFVCDTETGRLELVVADERVAPAPGATTTDVGVVSAPRGPSASSRASRRRAGRAPGRSSARSGGPRPRPR